MTRIAVSVIQNLLLRSDALDSAAWTKGGSTITANADTGPDGVQNADRIVEGVGGTIKYVTQAPSPAGTHGVFTYSHKLKAGTRSWAALSLDGGTTVTYFNLGTGALGTVGAGVTATIVAEANGYYRCTITTARAATGASPVTLVATGNLAHSYSGDGTSYITCAGAQLVRANWAGPYVATEAAAVNTGAIRNRAG